MKARYYGHTQLPRTEPRAPTEIIAIAYLEKNGIPCFPGKTLAQSYVDVIAFGCVLIEVKYSRLKMGRFHFVTTPRQMRKGFSGELVLLVCDYGDRHTFHFFDPRHPVFWMKGRVKSSFDFTPGAMEAKKHGNNRVVMTQPLMDDAENRIDMIDDALRSHQTRLRHKHIAPELITA